MRTCPPTVLDFYFEQLGILVGIVKQHIRDFMQDILKIIKEFWRTQPSLQPSILRLIESMSRAAEDKFKPFLPTLIPLMLQTVETETSAGRPTTRAVLQTLLTFGPDIEEYMHLIIPAIMDTVENDEAPSFLRKEAIATIARLSRIASLLDHASRIIHPLARVIVSSSFELRGAAMDTLCALVFSLGYEYTIFIPMINKLLVKSKISHPTYEMLVDKLLKGESLPQDLSPERKYGDTHVDEVSNTDPSSWRLTMNKDHLRAAWQTSGDFTKDDWLEWSRRLNLELLKESPSPALRSCAMLASSYAPLGKELFNPAFLSCFAELDEEAAAELQEIMFNAFRSATAPRDLVQNILNLYEYMEHADKTMSADVRTTGAYSGKCHAWAKALHYKETEYLSGHNPDIIEALISINKELQLPDAAIGILTEAQRHDEFELAETWYEKLQRWEDALAAWNRRPEQDSVEVLQGKMRCYHALGEWDQLSQLVRDRWLHATKSVKTMIAPHAAAGAWNLGQWEMIDDYVSAMKSNSADYSFFKAIICLHRNEFPEAATHIRSARDLVDRELTTLVTESYARAYRCPLFLT
jgi:serine/threonine-protein kinase mTOR